MVDLQTLQAIDRAAKPAGADEEWRTLQAYYEDSARDTTTARLAQLGVGLRNNQRPIEVQLLRRIIERIAVVYDSPPTRFLERASGELYKENSQQHQQMLRLVRRSQLDLAWSEVDKCRGLHRQAVLRFFPSRHERSVVCRVFPPHCVMRRVDPACSSLLDHDEQVAFRLSGDIWEVWTHQDSGAWHVARTDRDGQVVQDLPEYEGGIAPYSEIPAVIIYDRWPGGRAWLPPRMSRRAWVEATNAIANDLWSLIVHQAHSTRVWKMDTPPPADRGHGREVQIPEDSDVLDLTPNPKIAECNDVLDRFVGLWNWSEDLPAGDLDKRTEVETGASLRVHERPLAARREAQKPLADMDERRAWRKLVAVHNEHAEGWGEAQVEHDAEMVVELAPMDHPVSDEELLNAAAKKLALGSASVIDLIQQQERVTRQRAIQIYQRVREDMRAYPPTVRDTAEVVDGQQAASIDPPQDGASTVQVLADLEG